MRPTRRSILQQENEATRARNAEADAIAVASSSSSSSQVRPVERGPLQGPPKWVDESEESSSGEFLEEKLAERKFKEGVLEREAERERVRAERERRGLVLGTDHPDPKPSTSRRRQREDLDLLLREKEEEARKEKYRKLLDRSSRRKTRSGGRKWSKRVFGGLWRRRRRRGRKSFERWRRSLLLLPPASAHIHPTGLRLIPYSDSSTTDRGGK